MTTQHPTRTADLIARFSDDVNAQLATTHAVTSPAGLWLLLALLAPAATGDDRAALEAALGTDTTDAARRAAELITDTHPAVATALATWSRPELLDRARFDRWAADLPPSAATGPVPTQEQANAWAKDHSFGLIDRFPVTITDDTAAVLASAVAARVAWTEPFTDVPASDLGGQFGQRVTSALRAPDAHTRYLVRTDAAGLVAVHVARSANGLRVLSVIAAPDVPPAAVHTAARQVDALLRHQENPGAEHVSLFDLPLGDGHAWTVTEEVREVLGGAGSTEESLDAVLPAWDATSDHDLTDLPAVAAAGRVLASFLAPGAGPGDVEARQAATASYTRDGFEAAAVTGMALRATSLPARRVVRHRHATVRFNRPFAVLAVATNRGVDPAKPWRRVDLATPAWEGLPVFSAWVERPTS